MKYARPSAWFAVACVAVYALRAISAWMDGWAYPIGKRLAGEGQHELALPLLERGAIGAKRPAALWLAGQVRIAMWLKRAYAGEPSEAIDDLLHDAFRDQTRALAMSPASGWFRVSLGEVYHRLEQIERFRHGIPLELMDRGRWGFVGRPGRVAIGLTRLGIAREPNWFLFHDQLALMLLDDNLDEESLAAVRRSALALPLYPLHAYRDLDPPPREFIDAFAEGARSALGQAPLVSRAAHLMALGRLEHRRGRWEQSVADLEEALALPEADVYRGLANLYLGYSLIELGRFDQAREALVEAQGRAGTAVEALSGRARLAEAQGDLQEALTLWREARRLRPHHMGFILRYARLARRLEDWSRAEEALRWGMTIAPQNIEPRRMLIELHLDRGELAEAREMLADLRRMRGTEGAVLAIEKRLAETGRE